MGAEKWPRYKDGMCGQDRRLHCQCLSPDKDMRETRSYPVLIPDFKQRQEFILTAKILFSPNN